MQPIKDKTDPASYRGIYLNDTVAKLFEGLLLVRLTTTLSPLTNLAPNLAHRHMTLSTLSFPPSNTTSIHLRNLHMWPLLTTPQPTPQCTEIDCHTQKIKVMVFFETPSLQKARGAQHRPGPTLPPFHIHAPFPISSPCPTSSLRYSNSNT